MLREVIEDPLFTEQKADIHDDPRVVDTLLEAIIFILARSPEEGTPTEDIPAWHIYALTTTRGMGAPPLVIFYEFDDAQVLLKAVRRLAEY